MSYRTTNEDLAKQIGMLNERLRKVEAGVNAGTKWNQRCSSFGCITLHSPKSDFGGADTLDVVYEILPIWPGQSGYPGLRVTRTETNLVTGGVVVTTSVITV